MNKNLLTLAGLLSLLVVNQAFGTILLTIKNETAKPQEGTAFPSGCIGFGRRYPFSLVPGETKKLDTGCKNWGSLRFTSGERYVIKRPTYSQNPRTNEIILTIKTVNGKTVVVENQ